MRREARDPTRPGHLLDNRQQMHLWGFMGSGKSTVGKLVARRLLWNFLDLDVLVERHAGRSIAAIFASDGESAFRELERQVLRQATQKPQTVLALGGGAVIDAGNRALSRSTGLTVWLDCPLEIIEGRLEQAGAERPLWRAGGLEELYRDRLDAYREAEIRVDASGAAAEVAEAVLRQTEAARGGDAG